MSDLQLRDLTRAMADDQHARTFSRLLTAMVKHVDDFDGQRMFLERTARTVHEKAAVGALLAGTAPDYQLNAQRFLSGPAKRRLLAQLGGFSAPPFTRLQSVTAPPVGRWTAAGKPIVCSRVGFATTTTDNAAFGFIIPYSREVMTMSDDRAVSAVERRAALYVVKEESAKALSSDAAVAGVSAAGLLAAAPEFGLGSPAALDNGLEAACAYVSSGAADRLMAVTSPRVAFWMSMQHSEGGALFPFARVDGAGHIGGIPLLVDPAAANQIVLIDSGQLVVVDEGMEVLASDNAAVLMDDDPSEGEVQLVSGWQTGTVFLRVIRHLWWGLLTDDAVAIVTLGELAGSPS